MSGEDDGRTIRVTFEPDGVEKESSLGPSILEIAQRAKVDIYSPWGGEGLCGRCGVHVSGDFERLSPPPPPRAREKGYLKSEDYSKWLTKDGLHSTTVSMPGLSGKELLEMCDQARREFYIRPSYVMRKAAQSATKPGELKRNLKSSKTFFKYIFRDNK